MLSARRKTYIRRLVSSMLVVCCIMGIFAATPVNGQGTKPSYQGPAGGGQNTGLPSQLMKLFVIGKETFCSRLLQAFSSVGVRAGLSPSQTAVLATGAASRVIDDFRSGRPSDFIHSASLLSETKLPMDKGIPGYLSTAQYLGQALGTSDKVSLVLSASELRFMPHVPKNTDMIVVARNAAALTNERVSNIVGLARQNDIKIHVLWVGTSNESNQEIEEARVLAWMVSSTGGRFINLGGQDWPCANLM